MVKVLYREKSMAFYNSRNSVDKSEIFLDSGIDLGSDKEDNACFDLETRLLTGELVFAESDTLAIDRGFIYPMQEAKERGKLLAESRNYPVVLVKENRGDKRNAMYTLNFYLERDNPQENK